MATNLITITAETEPSESFVPTGDFEITVDAGQVMVQTQVDGEWYFVSQVGGALPSLVGYGDKVILAPLTSTKMTSIEASRPYRLYPFNGAVTASAWQLA